MSTKKKGVLTTSKVWAKHLRPYWKRMFWKGERKAGVKEGRKQYVVVRSPEA